MNAVMAFTLTLFMWALAANLFFGAGGAAGGDSPPVPIDAK